MSDPHGSSPGSRPSPSAESGPGQGPDLRLGARSSLRGRGPQPQPPAEASFGHHPLDQRVQAVVADLWERAPAWRVRLEEAGLSPDIAGVADLERLPLLTKSAMAAAQRADPPFGGFLAGGEPGTLGRIFMSPGPIYEPALPDGGGFAEGLSQAGIRAGDVVINTFGYHLTPAGSAFEAAAVAVGATVIPAGNAEIGFQLQALADLPINGYLGIPSFLATLLERAPAWKPERAVVAAERLDSPFRAALEERVGTVRQVYGTAETGFLAGECVEGMAWHVASGKVVAVCDPDTGEPLPAGEVGEVVVTTLTPPWPLLRFGTGDLSRLLPSSACSCGRDTPVLDGVLGRSGPGVKVRGMFVYDHHVTGALEGRRGQLRITRDAHKDVLVLVVEGDLTAADEEAVGERFRAAAKVRAEVRPSPPGTLSPGDPPISDARDPLR